LRNLLELGEHTGAVDLASQDKERDPASGLSDFSVSDPGGHLQQEQLIKPLRPLHENAWNATA